MRRSNVEEELARLLSVSGGVYGLRSKASLIWCATELVYLVCCLLAHCVWSSLPRGVLLELSNLGQ